jgi:hypothetical protein
VGSKAFGGLHRRLKEKTAESRWFETTGQAPFGRAKAAYWKIKGDARACNRQASTGSYNSGLSVCAFSHNFNSLKPLGAVLLGASLPSSQIEQFRLDCLHERIAYKRASLQYLYAD